MVVGESASACYPVQHVRCGGESICLRKYVAYRCVLKHLMQMPHTHNQFSIQLHQVLPGKRGVVSDIDTRSIR